MVPFLIEATARLRAGGVASHLRRCPRRGWPRSGPPAPEAPGEDRSAWQVGQRVSHKDSADLGTVVEANGKIKVKWDHGYFSHGDRANVEPKPE
jgi:hypothetical protein